MRGGVRLIDTGRRPPVLVTAHSSLDSLALLAPTLAQAGGTPRLAMADWLVLASEYAIAAVTPGHLEVGGVGCIAGVGRR